MWVTNLMLIGAILLFIFRKNDTIANFIATILLFLTIFIMVNEIFSDTMSPVKKDTSIISFSWPGLAAIAAAFITIAGTIVVLNLKPDIKETKAYMLLKIICSSLTTLITLIIGYLAVLKTAFPKEKVIFDAKSIGLFGVEIILFFYIVSISFNIIDSIKLKQTPSSDFVPDKHTTHDRVVPVFPHHGRSHY